MTTKKLTLTEAARIAKGDLVPPSMPIQFDGESHPLPDATNLALTCGYCGGEADHKHDIEGWPSCGGCCGMHGEILIADSDKDRKRIYDWVEMCAKNHAKAQAGKPPLDANPAIPIHGLDDSSTKPLPAPQNEELAEVDQADSGKWFVYIPCGIEIADCHDRATAEWICAQWNRRSKPLPAPVEDTCKWGELRKAAIKDAALLLPTDCYHCGPIEKCSCGDWRSDFQKLANPAAILELLSELDRLSPPARQVAAPVEPAQTFEGAPLSDYAIGLIAGGLERPFDWAVRSMAKEIRERRVAAPVEEGQTFVLNGFIEAMNDIGRYGFEKYRDQSFQARAKAGDTSRSMQRTQTETIGEHVGEHYAMYSRGELHDHFGTLKHQLAACAFNAMMEYYFAGLDASSPIEEAGR